MKYEQEIAENKIKEFEQESENQQVCVMFTTKSDLAEIVDNVLPCYALKCEKSLVPMEDISSSLSLAITNLLRDSKSIKQWMTGGPHLSGLCLRSELRRHDVVRSKFRRHRVV